MAACDLILCVIMLSKPGASHTRHDLCQPLWGILGRDSFRMGLKVTQTASELA